MITKNNNIYIIMYHYVREIKKSKYPSLKGLEYKDFKNQIKYFSKNFNILSNNDFIEIMYSKKLPKKKSIILTFDDGYKDHYKYVYPFLLKNKLPANFYPPIQAVKNKKVLDVNKIHFILEKEHNRDKIIKLIFFYSKKYFNKSFTDKELKAANFKHRYDDPKTTLVKRLLQHYIPEMYREKILNKIFSKILNTNEEDFSKKLYINTSELRELYKDNFTIGSHGYNHLWLEKLNNSDQEQEISRSINYFKKINVYKSNFSVCFPYGSYNDFTLKILKKYKVKYGLASNFGSINSKNINDKFTFPRFDTNDFK